MKRQILFFLILITGALFFGSSRPAAAVAPGTLIKGASSTAVYYFAQDGKRHVFPTDKIYFSWYADFSGVTRLTDAELAAIMLGSNVTYHPGMRLVKIQTDPKVYAIGPGGLLHPIASESVAAALFGADWNKQVDDIPDAFFVNYRLDTEIRGAADFDVHLARNVASINDDLGVRASGGSSSPTPSPTPVSPTLSADPVNLIPNASLEIFSADAKSPASWDRNVSDGSTARFVYPVLGHDGKAAAQVNITAYTSGSGAKWYFDPVSVVPGAEYEFSDYYTSTTPSIVTLQFALDDGHFKYVDLLKLVPTDVWTKAVNTFVAPEHAVSVKGFHLIQSVGTLTTDSFFMKKLTPAPFSSGMISLTFDDGLTSAYQNGIPLLDEAGIRTSQYIITQDFGQDVYVDVDQTKAMKASGHEIGAHTRTHPHLSQLSQAEMVAEVAGSKTDLAALGMDPVSFVYPYDDFNDAVERAVVAAGFRGARTTREGFNTKNTNPYELKDMHVESKTTIAQVKAWIAKALADKTWLILELHNVDESGLQYSVTPDFLQQLIAAITSSGISVVTTSEGLTAMGR